MAINLLRPLPDYGLFGVFQRFRRISLEMTTLCNNRCFFCGAQANSTEKRKTMDIADLKIILSRVPDQAGHCIPALGGESWLLDDLPERIALIKKNWPKTSIGLITTFNIDRGRDFIEHLFVSGLSSITISVYAYTNDDYKIVHGSDAFDAVCRNIEYIGKFPAEYTARVSIHMMPDVAEAASIELWHDKAKKFLHFSKRNGIHLVNSKPMHSWQERVANAPSREKASFPCSVVWGSRAGQLIIDVNCNVIPCCYAGGQGITFGNLREASLKEIYTSPAFTDFYEKHWDGDLSGYPLCNRCVEPFPAASPDEQTRLAVWQGELLAGRKVYFWGCGETYRKYRQYFARAKPQAFLLDIDECVGMYDDLPVRHPDNVLKSGEKLPVVIFAAPENNERILSTIKEKYPCLNRQDLICCPADLGEKRRCVTAPLHIISPPPPDKSGILQWQHEKFSEIGWDYEKAVAKINTILPTFGIRETWRDDIIRNASQHWIAMAAIPEESVQRILEIGTFSGNTTALLAVLFPQSEIVTCDLPDDSQQYISTYGRLDIRKKYTLEQERERNITAKNITFIQKNSFLLPRYTQGEFDLIWIDGGHEYPDVAFDICNCFYMLSTHGIMLCDDIVIPDNMTKDSRNDTFNVFSPLVRDSIVNVKYIMKRLNVGIKQHLSGKMIAVVKKGI